MTSGERRNANEIDPPRVTPRRIEISLYSDAWARLEALAAAGVASGIEELVTKLLDHVDQGIYRPGSWERDWLRMAAPMEAIHAADRAAPRELVDRRERS